MERLRTTVVTGSTTGIGLETARALAKEGDRLILLNRNEAKSRAVVEELKRDSGNDQINFIVTDLASQADVRRASDKIREQVDKLDVLINNAGTWFSKHRLTEDGIEMQLAVNHLSPFLLTHLLLPLLLRSEDGRIVNISSDTHFRGKIQLDDLNMEKSYHGLRSYARSKLAMVMATYVLDRKLEGTSVKVNAVQPGLVKTDMGHKHTIGLHSAVWWLRKMGGVSPDKGAETSVYLASSPEVRTESGKYWDRCRPKPSSKLSYDEEMQMKIWEWSKEQADIGRYVPDPAG